MNLLYVDTSAVIRAYFPDEDDHEALRQRVLLGSDPVVSSEVTRIEVASAISGAHRAGRLTNPKTIQDQFDVDCSQAGLITLLRLDPQTALPLAYRLVAQYPLRTMDAIHLAVALTDAVSLAEGDEVTMVTRDKRQAAAARAQGLNVV